MAAQKSETGRNYIGLVNDEADEMRANDATPGAAHRVKHYVLGLMATTFNRRAEAR